MSRRQKLVLLALAIVVALTRLAAVSRSMFDWDEAQFTLAVAEYDVAGHRPHPPGYPLFVGAAKLVHAFGVPEFRALQAVTVAGAMLLFPAVFALARAMGFGLATSACGALLFAFLPNVWVYGGTGFSDVPAAAAGLCACALLLRGRRDSRAYLAGAVLLGVAAGFRPTNLLVGLVPAIVATRERWRVSRAVVFAAIVAGMAVVAASYGGAALASASPRAFVEAVREQQEWVRTVDSWRSPTRPPLFHAAKIFWLWGVQNKPLMIVLALLGLVSLGDAMARRRPAPLLVLACFAPMALFAWLNLDTEAASRYAISYMAAHALLAAGGLEVLALRRAPVQAALCAVLLAVMVVWTLPAVRLQREEPSPPWRALVWARDHVPPGAPLYVFAGFRPLAAVALGDRHFALFDRPAEVPVHGTDFWVVSKGRSADAINFIWPHGALWDVVRRRNFEVALQRRSSSVRFGDGWYAQEATGEGSSRWMSAASSAVLPGARGRARLALGMSLPAEAFAERPTIEIVLNSAVVDRFVAPAVNWQKSWVVDAAAGANALTIRTTRTVVPARLGVSGDARELGLRLDSLSWTAAR